MHWFRYLEGMQVDFNLTSNLAKYTRYYVRFQRFKFIGTKDFL